MQQEYLDLLVDNYVNIKKYDDKAKELISDIALKYRDKYDFLNDIYSSFFYNINYLEDNEGLSFRKNEHDATLELNGRSITMTVFEIYRHSLMSKNQNP